MNTAMKKEARTKHILTSSVHCVRIEGTSERALLPLAGFADTPAARSPSPLPLAGCAEAPSAGPPFPPPFCFAAAMLPISSSFFFFFFLLLLLLLFMTANAAAADL